MNNFVKPLAIAAAVGSCVVGYARAELPIANAGFEDDVLANGGAAIPASGWSNFGGGACGAFNPTTTQYDDEAPVGQNVGFCNFPAGTRMCQDVGVVANNETFEASVLVGRRKDEGNVASCKISLRSTSGERCESTVTPGQNSFSPLSCNFTAAASDVDDGETLQLCIGNETANPAQCNFDELAATPVDLLRFDVD